MKNSLTKLAPSLAVLALLAGFAFGPAGSAFADAPAGGNASCMGYESWAVPAGSDPSEPLGMLSVLALVDETAAGGTRGSVISFLGQLHLGSHDESNDSDCP